MATNNPPTPDTTGATVSATPSDSTSPAAVRQPIDIFSVEPTTASVHTRTCKDVTYFPPGTQKYKFLYHLENYGLAQIITNTLLAPIERWKITKQTQRSLLLEEFKPFSGAFSFFSRVPKQQGWLSFWRGNGAACMMYLSQLSATYLCFQNINHFFDWKAQTAPEEYARLFLNALAASFCSNAFTYPFDTVRTRLTMQSYKTRQQHHFGGIYDTMKSTKLDLYKGFWVSVFSSTLFFFAFKSSQDAFKGMRESGKSIDEQVDLAVSILISNLLVYPLDTIKRRLQLNNLGRGLLHNNARHLLQQIAKNQSPLALYHGLSASIFKHVLAFPLYFSLVKLKQDQKLNYF